MSIPDYTTTTQGFTIVVKFNQSGSNYFGKVTCPVPNCGEKLNSNAEPGVTQAKYRAMQRVRDHFRRKHKGLDRI